METKNESIKIQYPEDRWPVCLKGESRFEDLKGLLCQGQGIYNGLDMISCILDDDSNYWKSLLLSFLRIFSNNVQAKKNPLAPADSCFVPGRYVCITKDGKFVVADRSKEGEKFVWNRDNLVLYFTEGSASVRDLLYYNELL